METALIKRIGFKVVRKLKVVRAFAPQRRPDDAVFQREIGTEQLTFLISKFPDILPGLQQSKTISRIEREFPREWAETINVARNTLRHRFDLLGSGLVDLGPQIDWCTDFKSGKSWDRRDYRLQKLVNLNDNSDVKIPWELSRCNHFLSLALAYLSGNDECYALEFENQVLSWAEQNEYLQTVNWSCPMDTAIRCINWLLAYKILAARRAFSEEFTRFFTIELYKGAKSIHENLEKTGDGHNTNHYLSNLLGLLYLGQLFAGTALRNNWREFAIAELERELEAQVNSDGLDYESSLPYHGLVTEIYLMAHILSLQSNFHFSDRFEHKLGTMITNLARFTGQNGLIENFGDNDDGRILKLFARAARDYRDVISTGAASLKKPELPECTITPELLCFGIEPQVGHPEHSREWPSIHLVESGICQLRSKDLTLNFFANPIGTAGLGNHKHNDFLSFTLSYKGTPVFADPGSYVYTVDEDVRNQFRSTRSHNTVMVDDNEQNRMVRGLLFLLRTDGDPTILDWQSTPEFDLVVAEHDCYQRLDDAVMHRRTIYLCKLTQTVLIRDELLGNDAHNLEFNFHIERMKISALENHLVQLIPRAGEPGLLFANSDTRGCFQIDAGWISPSYGVKYPSINLIENYTAPLPLTIVHAITPLESHSKESALRTISTLRDKLRW